MGLVRLMLAIKSYAHELVLVLNIDKHRFHTLQSREKLTANNDFVEDPKENKP